jgi:uncharacterized protein (TIGR03437 family)
MLATVTGDTSSGYTGSITVGASFQAAAASAPTISSGGVTNAVSGAAVISPASWVSIYGTNLTATTRLLATADLVNNTIPTTWNGVSVSINGKAAFVQYVSPTQINVLAPADTDTGPVAITVTNAAGTSNSVTAAMQQFLPGLSVLSNYVRAVRYPDGAIVNGTGAAETGYTVSAAVGQGDIVALYGTGFGPTNSAPWIREWCSPALTRERIKSRSRSAVLLPKCCGRLVAITPSWPPSRERSSQSPALIKAASSAKLPEQTAGWMDRVFGPHAKAKGFVPDSLSKPLIERVVWTGGLAGQEQYSRAACAAAPEDRLVQLA